MQPGGGHLLLSNCISPLSYLPSTASSSDSDEVSPPSSPLIDSGYSSGPSEVKFQHTALSSASGSDSDSPDEKEVKNATRAFFGGINNHSGAAKERMRCMRVARLGE